MLISLNIGLSTPQPDDATLSAYGNPTQSYLNQVTEFAKRHGRMLMVHGAQHADVVCHELPDVKVNSLVCVSEDSVLVPDMLERWSRKPPAAVDPANRNYYLAPSMASN